VEAKAAQLNSPSLVLRQLNNRAERSVRPLVKPEPPAGSENTTEKSGTDLAIPPIENSPRALHAFFAKDEAGRVVVRVEDAEGKLVRQFPPEELAKMHEMLGESLNSLFHEEA